MIRLKDIAKIISGQAAPKEFSTEGLPFIRAGHLEQLLSGFGLSNIPKVSEEVAKNKRLKKIPKGTIIFAKSGMSATKNRIYVTDSECYFVSHLAGIIPLNEHSVSYISRFLSWYNPSKLILDEAYPSIRLEDIGNLLIPLPPLDQQKKIANILDTADAYRQKTKGLIEKYDELTQSLFLDMFGDPVSNPMGWKKVKFNEVGKLDRGKSKHRPRNAPELLGGEHPLIQTGDLANCGIFLSTYKSTYSDIGLKQSKKWSSGTLCISIAANIAKTGILTFDACFPDSVVGFTPNEKTNNIYTLFWLSFLQKMLEDTAPESAQKNINLSILRELDFPLPDISLQDQFAERVKVIEEQKAHAQASFALAEDLFNSLLQRAFKGELTST